MYYLMWLFFKWVTPYVMSISWGWFIAYILIAGGLFSAFVGQIQILLIMPMAFLITECRAAKYPPVLFGLFFCYQSLKWIWTLSIDYGLLQWILAVSLTIMVLISYIFLIVAPFKVEEEE